MFFKKMFFLMAFAAILFSVSGSGETPGYKVLFEKAKFAMETKGDLNEAIKLFQKIIKEYPAYKEYAAKSQLKIGICYEKLGLKKSREAYRKVINNYPEYQQEVSVARQRLARLVKLAGERLSKPGTAASVIEKEGREILLQQVWANPIDNHGAPSPDGRYLSYINFRKPQLALYEINTGKTRELPSTAGKWRGAYKWPESSIWSPDGKQLAYVWYDKSKDENGQDRPIAIRIVDIDGAGPRELFSDKGVSYPHPFSWSRDGRFILAILWKAKGQEMVLINVKDGSINSLNKWERDFEVTGARLSPDGKYVVYTKSPDPDSPQTDIYLLTINGGGKTVLIEHPATDYSPFWSPDGKNILFFSNRAGSVGLWVQKINNGKPIGEQRLVKSLNRLSPLGITQDGHLFMAFLEGRSDVYSVEIDPDTGNVVSTPRRAVESNIGWNYAPCFSHDGNYMAYISKRGFLPWQAGWGQESMIILDLRSGEERELIPQLRTLIDGPRGQPQWSPDGREILINGRNKWGILGQYIVDVTNGKITQSFVRGSDHSFEPVWSKDGEKLFFYKSGIPDNFGVYSLERATGETTKLCAEKGISELALHPDGNTLAVATREAIKLLSITDGKIRELIKAQVGSLRGTIAWAPDGNWLYFGKWNKEKKVSELWRVSANGSNVKDLGISFPQLSFISVHPDGKRLAFTRGFAAPIFSIWLMKNFLKEK
jgi:Tol biopolymer transport system component